MWQEIFKYLTEISPPIFWAVLTFFIGWFVAKWFGKIVSAFLTKFRLNQVLKNLGLEEALVKIDTSFNVSKFFGEIVRWFFIILFLMLTSEIIGLTQFSQFLEKVIGYYLNIFIACLIFLVAVFFSNLSQKVVVGTLEKEKITYSRFLGKAISWGIWFFAIIAILYQLKIIPTLILAIFIGGVATFSIVLGIAFGLGGKELAAKILKELEEKFK